MFIYNLETDFQKYESTGTVSYYGYAQSPGIPSDATGWSIRRVVGTGPTLDVEWSNKARLSYISKWSEKEDYFDSAGLSASPINVTYSVNLTSNSFGIETASINLQWGDLPGVDTYKVIFTDQNNITYNGLFAPFMNAYIFEPYTAYVPSVPVSGGTVSYLFRGTSNMTYSVTVVGDNKYQNPPFSSPVVTITT
jgi:hypothetical protein